MKADPVNAWMDFGTGTCDREARIFIEYPAALRRRNRMMVSFFPKLVIVPNMKQAMTLMLGLCLILPLAAESKRKSLLDSDPDVVYLAEIVKKPLKLKVVKEAPVYSSKQGHHRLGTLKAGQDVQLEAITEDVYRVRGQGTRNGIAGWVAPWAFSSNDPDFVEHLKQLYVRQIEVQGLIADKAVAVGMTLDEVNLSRGKPTKTSVRKTAEGQSGTWEYVDYDEVKNYVTRIDPVTGGVFRQLSHITRVEKGKTKLEFNDNVVTAVEESEDNRGGNVRIIVPPLVFGW